MLKRLSTPMTSRACNYEVRTTAGITSPSPGKLVGYAAVFGAPADLGEFTETVRPGAFTATLAERNANVLALFDHERRSVLGRTGAGTLKLAEDRKGLHFELALPDTSMGRDLAVLVERGDVAGCSFGFVCNADEWEMRAGNLHRELVAVTLHEITITPTPAYVDTEVAKRAASVEWMIRDPIIATRRAWLETCR